MAPKLTLSENSPEPQSHFTLCIKNWLSVKYMKNLQDQDLDQHCFFIHNSYTTPISRGSGGRYIMSTSHTDPYTTPTLPAPPGHHSQLLHPPRKTMPTILCLTLAIVLSAFFVALRMYTRRFISRKLWWDDCTFEILAHCYHAMRL